MLAAFLLLGASLRFDVAVGGARPASSSECCSGVGSYPWAPLLHLGAAVEVSPHLSVGLTTSLLLGGEGADHALEPAGPSPGFEAWNTLLALRAHSRIANAEAGPDLFIEGGAGIGHLISMQIDYDVEHAWLRGHSGAALEVTVGGSYLLSRRLSVGLQASWMLWTKVEQHAYEIGGGMFQPAQDGMVVTALSVAATVAFASPL